MSVTTTLELASKIKPELIAQELTVFPKLVDGMKMQEVFKAPPKIINAPVLDINKIAKAIKSIPYVHQADKGVAANGSTEVDQIATVPPMKIHVRLTATELKRMQYLKGQEFMAWMREEIIADLSRNKDFSMEYLKRSMLTTGNLSYPYIVGNSWTTAALTLGTMVNDETFSNPWSTAGTTFTQIANELDNMRRVGMNTTTSASYFQSLSDIKVYATDADFNYLYGKLAGLQTIDVVKAADMGNGKIRVGDFVVERFPATYLRPGATDASTDAVTAHEIRMIDTSASAPHKIAMLELDNVNAIGANKHFLLQVVPDTFGEYIDIQLQFRPVPLFIPEACIKAIVSS